MQIKDLDQFSAAPTNKYPKLFAYQDNGPPITMILDHWPPLPAAPAIANSNLRVVDSNTMRINFPMNAISPTNDESGQAQAKGPSKTIHLVWQQGADTDQVDWPLKVTSSAGAAGSSSAAKFTADPSVLFVSDSRAVKFTSSSAVGCFVSAQFEGGANLLQIAQPGGAGSSGPSTTSFTLQIPSTLTATPGYKEIIVKVNKASTSGGKTTCTTTAATDSVAGILVVGPGVNRQ